MGMKPKRVSSTAIVQSGNGDIFFYRIKFDKCAIAHDFYVFDALTLNYSYSIDKITG